MDEGFGAVSLPNALDSKYPSGSKKLKWQRLFPQKNRWKNELTGQEGRWHVDESLMQRAVKNAILEAGINKNAQLPHFPPFFCNSPDRIRLRHPHHTGTSRAQRCEHHHDLYPCSEPRIWRRGKSAGENVDFYKYPCKICANSQKIKYNKKISKDCKDFTMDTEKLCYVDARTGVLRSKYE